MAKPKTFEEAKALADKAYMDYWQDRLDSASAKWTKKDFDLIKNPKYKKVGIAGRPQKKVRILPKGYEDYKQAKDFIKKGPLDFTSEKTYDLLINTPMVKGGNLPAKQQYWISKDNPIRQAVEAQSAVMKKFLKDNDISIVRKYKDIEGFDRPDSFRGKGFYLNTGTGAHIDWGSSLKRGQDYRSPSNSKLGTYSHVFVRPDPEGLAKPLAFVAALTGNPWLNAASTLASGGDLEDVVKGVVVGKAVSPVLDTIGGAVATLPTPVQNIVLDTAEAVITGESGTDAFKESATGELIGVGKEMLADADIDLPDFETPQIVKDVGDFAVDVLGPPAELIGETFEPVIEAGEQVLSTAEDVLEPVKEAVETGGEFIVDAADEVIDIIDSPLGDLLKGVVSSISGISGTGGTGGMMAGARKPTQVEGIFDKELFKFDTEIKSTQEMLSPMMNKNKRYA